MRKLFTVLPVCIALLTPVATLYAQDEHHDDQHRYYDKKHKDYHQWNADEDRAWHSYLDQQHRKYIDFSRASAAQQQAYWNWRHDHPDGR